MDRLIGNAVKYYITEARYNIGYKFKHTDSIPPFHQNLLDSLLSYFISRIKHYLCLIFALGVYLISNSSKYTNYTSNNSEDSNCSGSNREDGTANANSLTVDSNRSNSSSSSNDSNESNDNNKERGPSGNNNS